MRFAEVFLRLGTSLVAWMVLYAYFLWLATLAAMGCGPDGDEMHRLMLGLTPFACGFAFMLRITRPFTEIHGILRWLGVPLMLLLPFGIRSVWQVYEVVYVNSTAICANGAPTMWQLVWAPAQAATLLLVSYQLIRVWLNSKLDAQIKKQELERSN